MNGVPLRTSQTQSVMIFPAVLTDPYMIKLSILSGDAESEKNDRVFLCVQHRAGAAFASPEPLLFISANIATFHLKPFQKAGSHKEVKSHHENIVMAFIILSYFNKAIVSEISRYNCSLLSRVYEISSSGSSKSNEMLNSLG